jgi:branched-chain amino acid aminotransferase
VADTFVSDGGAFVPLAHHPDFSSASGALPHGSYTTLRTYQGARVLRLEQHARRLVESLPTPTPLSLDWLRSGLRHALEATGHPESRMRVTYAPPRLFVTIEPFVPLPEEAYRDGARCVTVPVRRENPHAKDTRFIATAARAYEALAPGIGEGLMVAPDGSLLEGLSSNFFGVVRGVLRTEDERVLPGVTRALVLEVAAGVLPIVTSALRLPELGSVDECFVTSVSREILPIVAIDARTIGSGKPGPVTTELRRRFAALVENEARSLRD